MRILVACEYSGRVREAFKAKGHEAWSVDLEPTDIPGSHLQQDVLELLDDGWDMMIAFPPCTDLAVSGARYFAAKRADGRQQKSIEFFMALANAPIPRICIENPIGIMSSIWRKPDQIIQPWQFGEPESKQTVFGSRISRFLSTPRFWRSRKAVIGTIRLQVDRTNWGLDPKERN